MSEAPTAGRKFSGQNSDDLVVSDDVVSAWFLREILPLEAILMHYLRSNWRNASDFADLRQEVYARVFEAARERIPDNPKRFLFTTARNHLIDLVRREQIVPMETFGDFEEFDVAAEAPGPEQVVIGKEELHRVRTALAQLPARTREAIELAWFENLSCTEVAKRMGVTHPAASKFISTGTLILGRILYDMQTNRGAKS